MLQNIQSYDPERFAKTFKQTDLYRKLVKDFDEVTFDRHYFRPSAPTPREQEGDPQWLKTRFSAVPFYYLDFLTQAKPTVIYDLGCGWNIFKKYIPNIIGVGAEDPREPGFHADKHDFVDDDYIQGHQQYFQSVFSINALHFIPLSNIRNRVKDFASIIAPGGKGYVTFNLARLLQHDSEQFQNYSNLELDHWVRQQLTALPFQIEVFDLDFTDKEDGMDGNIRMVINKE